VRHPRLQRAWWLIRLRTNQGDEGSTGDEGVGQTERVGRIMVLEHLLQHAICCGFRVIQDCHSAFLGAYRAPLVAGGGRGLVRLSIQTWTGRRAVVVGHDQQVRRRVSLAAVRGAPRDTRGLRAVGTPVTQDWVSLMVRNMSRRPRAATAPLVLDPGAPLCPSIAENHGVDERSMRGVFPGSRGGTKLVF